jgi:hypothetical protein
MRSGFISAIANLRGVQVKRAGASGNRSNGTRQAIRGIKQMFREDGLLK